MLVYWHSPLLVLCVHIVQDDLDVHQQITCPTRSSDKYLWLHNIMQVQNNTLYNIMHWCVPFVLVPVFPESTTLSKDLVQSDQNPKSISNVLEHRLCHGKHDYNNNNNYYYYHEFRQQIYVCIIIDQEI